MLALSGVFMAMTFVVFAAYGVFAGLLRGRVLSRPQLLRRVQRGFAVTFAGLAGKLALTLALSHNRRMIDHIAIQCADVEASAAFYDTVLGAIGYRRVMDFGEVIGYGDRAPDFWIGPLNTGDGLPREPPGVPRARPRRGPGVLRRWPSPRAPRCCTSRASGRSTTRPTTARSCATRTATTSRPSATRPARTDRPAVSAQPAKAPYEPTTVASAGVGPSSTRLAEVGLERLERRHRGQRVDLAVELDDVDEAHAVVQPERGVPQPSGVARPARRTPPRSGARSRRRSRAWCV